MPTLNDYGFALAAALTTAYVGSALGEDAQSPKVEVGSKPVPTKCELEYIRMLFDVTAGTPATVTWFLSEDAAGKHPITDERTDSILPTRNAAWFSLAIKLDIPYVKSSLGTNGTLYLNWKLDAGTADAQGFLVWRTA
jgi:hypothetical protein